MEVAIVKFVPYPGSEPQKTLARIEEPTSEGVPITPLRFYTGKGTTGFASLILENPRFRGHDDWARKHSLITKATLTKEFERSTFIHMTDRKPTMPENESLEGQYHIWRTAYLAKRSARLLSARILSALRRFHTDRQFQLLSKHISHARREGTPFMTQYRRSGGEDSALGMEIRAQLTHDFHEALYESLLTIVLTARLNQTPATDYAAAMLARENELIATLRENQKSMSHWNRVTEMINLPPNFGAFFSVNFENGIPPSWHRVPSKPRQAFKAIANTNLAVMPD